MKIKDIKNNFANVHEVNIDNVRGRGAVPYNQDIDYRGLRVHMRPSVFLSLAAPLTRDAHDEMKDFIRKGGAIGAPFLMVEFPEEVSAPPRIVGHEGRNRMKAIQSVEGDNPVEVHLLLRGRINRARNLTPELIKQLKSGARQEITGQLVQGPLWEDGQIVKGVNTTADVKPGETQRQAAKFGNRLNKKGEPPLLNARARKNSDPHTLNNLGLTESNDIGVQAFAQALEQKYNLKNLWISDMSNRNAIELSNIVVSRENQKQGVGSAVMQEIVDFAERHGRIIVLDPALKDKKHGTTSQSRLRQFYKRFGFIDNKGRNKDYNFRNLMIRYPKNKINESIDKAYGYKVMNYNPDTNEIVSGADSRVTKGVKLRKGMTLRMPGKGIFMSTNRDYVEQYYGGNNDHEVLIKFEFDPNTITSGNLTDRENEFTVPNARVVGFKFLTHLDEDNSFALDRNRWDKNLQLWLDAVEEKMEEVNDASMDYDLTAAQTAKIEKDYNALVAVEHVILNHQQAIKRQEPGHHFFYSMDLDDNAFTAMHIFVKDEIAEIKWLGSYNNSRAATRLMQNAKHIMIREGAKKVRLTAKWGSEGFYERLNFKRDSETRDDPISGTTYTDMSKGVDEDIKTIHRSKDEKFGLNLANFNPEGKKIGRMGDFDMYMEPKSHSDYSSPALSIVEPDSNRVVGFIGFNKMIQSLGNLAQNTLVTTMAVIDDDFQGRGIVLSAYRYLIRNGYTLVSDDIQTKGGQKIWQRLAKTKGIYVYAANLKNDAPTELYDVDPDDITDSGIMIYRSDDKKLSDLNLELRELRKEYLDYSEWLEDANIDREEGEEIDQDTYDEYNDIANKLEHELNAIEAEIAAWKKHVKGNNVRLVATREVKKTTNESIKIKKPQPEDTLGVRRADMPQVHRDHYPELIKYLADHGNTFQHGNISAGKLKPVQSEFSDAGVEKMMQTGGRPSDSIDKDQKPLIVSSDNYIIDGHHRWLAAYNLGEKVPIMRSSLPITQLFQLIKDFKHTTYKDIHENMSVTGTNRSRQDRKKNLLPGSEAWFRHWFSRPYLKRKNLEKIKSEAIDYVKGVRNEKAPNRRRSNRNNRTNESSRRK